MLVEHGAEINIWDNVDRPLDIAMRLQKSYSYDDTRAEIVKYLKSKGALQKKARKQPSKKNAQRKLHRKMVEACRLAFADLQRTFGNETFYAFAIFADSRGLAISPVAQTEEAYRRRVGAGENEPAEGYLGLQRYCPDEWDFAYGGATESSGDAWSEVEKLAEAIIGHDETYTISDEAFSSIFETMIQALSDLDGEGFFGQAEKRDAITLMIWFSDSDANECRWAESVKRLNPVNVYQRFMREIPPEYQNDPDE